jgi:hypothetical protein
MVAVPQQVNLVVLAVVDPVAEQQKQCSDQTDHQRNQDDDDCCVGHLVSATDHNAVRVRAR